TVYARIARAGQDPDDAMIDQLAPYDFAIMASSPDTVGKPQTSLAEGFYHGECRARATKGTEQMMKALLDLPVWIQFHLTDGSVNQTCWKPSSQFSAARLLQKPAAQSRTDQM